MLVCRRKCCAQVDVLRLRVGCSTTRTPLRIARLIVLTTAVTTPRTTPLCGLGCSGRSAPDERENFYIVEKVSLACKDKVRNTFQICVKKRTCLFRCLSHQGGVTFQRHNKTLCCVQTKNAGDIWTGNLVGIVVTVRGIRFQNKKWGILL